MHQQEDSLSIAECDGELEFHALGKRAVVGNFDGGMISSDPTLRARRLVIDAG
jgi:hypothetical protein